MMHRLPSYRRMLGVSAVSVALTLLVVGLFEHFVIQRGGRERSGISAPLEIGGVEDRRNSAGNKQNSAEAEREKPREVLEIQAPSNASVDAPAGLTVVRVDPPSKAGSNLAGFNTGPKTAVSITQSVQSPMPDLAGTSSAGPVSEEPAHVGPAPLTDPAHGVMDSHVSAEASPKVPVEAARQVEMAAADPTHVSSPDKAARDEPVSDAPSVPPIGRVSAPAISSSPIATSSTSSADASAVLAALGKYSNAWNTKRVSEITALRPGLPRRDVEQELSSTRSIAMRIQPTSVPQVQGNRATVECIHQVDQVFRDGIKRQNPGVKMTYILVRRGNSWLIEGSR